MNVHDSIIPTISGFLIVVLKFDASKINTQHAACCFTLHSSGTFEIIVSNNSPDSKVHGANMGPIWGRHDPGGPHVGPMNFAIFESIVDCYLPWASCVSQGTPAQPRSLSP